MISSAEPTTRVLLVGLGAIGDTHARALEATPSADVVAGVDVDGSRTLEFRGADRTVYPSLREARGLPRLRSMLARWMEKRIEEVTTGCIYISGAVEYDDRADSAVREQLVHKIGRAHV